MEKEKLSKNLSITIIIPTLNEENRITRTLESISEYISYKKNYDFELFIIDENSKDRTKEIFDSFCKIKNIDNFKFFTNKGKKRGKGASEKFILEMVSTDLFLLFDADSAVKIQYLDKFLDEKNFDLISGIRLNHPKSNSWSRHVIGLVNNLLLHLFLYREVVPDSTCGFKLVRTSKYRTIKDMMFVNTGFFDVELIYLFLQNCYKVKFIPVQWDNSPDSRINVLKSIFVDLLNIFKIKIKHRKR